VTKLIYFCNDLVTLSYSSEPNLYSTRDKKIDKSSSLAGALGVTKFMIFCNYLVILCYFAEHGLYVPQISLRGQGKMYLANAMKCHTNAKVLT